MRGAPREQAPTRCTKLRAMLAEHWALGVWLGGSLALPQ